MTDQEVIYQYHYQQHSFGVSLSWTRGVKWNPSTMPFFNDSFSGNETKPPTPPPPPHVALRHGCEPEAVDQLLTGVCGKTRDCVSQFSPVLNLLEKFTFLGSVSFSYATLKFSLLLQSSPCPDVTKTRAPVKWRKRPSLLPVRAAMLGEFATSVTWRTSPSSSIKGNCFRLASRVELTEWTTDEWLVYFGSDSINKQLFSFPLAFFFTFYWSLDSSCIQQTAAKGQLHIWWLQVRKRESRIPFIGWKKKQTTNI